MNKKIILFCFLLSILAAACVQKKYGTPTDTNATDATYPIYKTIAEIRANMGVSGAKEIKENIFISGVVIAEDRNGNFYKQIIIDDGTGAMPILLDAYNLYNDYPIGTKIYVKCKGLFTNFYYKLPQLGYAADSRGVVAPIPFYLWKQYIEKGSSNNKVKAIEVSVADAMKAKPELYNRLIALSDAQIMDTSAATIYALNANLSSATNIKLMDCDSNTITLRTSGYSSFQALKPPTGKGKLTAIYTVYNSTPQLVIRDTADVQLKGVRCF